METHSMHRINTHSKTQIHKRQKYQHMQILKPIHAFTYAHTHTHTHTHIPVRIHRDTWKLISRALGGTHIHRDMYADVYTEANISTHTHIEA